ncbi:CoA-acylating methylmalonate-semialdehyde dehydrogenase, partial [Halomonas sp. 707D4]|nr:CoA-acylating methylmalonate-semialdehyde dehydrogenase [Halomonas sp. 707D4]
MAVRDIPLFIDGKPVASRTDQWRDVVNPATQEVVARVPMCPADEVERAIESARQAFGEWRKTPLNKRMRIMMKLAALIREHTGELAALITEEHGKTLPDAEGEVGRGLEVVEHACSITSLQLGEVAENAASEVDVYTLHQPLGVGAGITAFNFPIMLPCFMFPLAIATGNTFVLKPSEQDPSSTMRLVELAHEAGVPPGVLNVVHGGPEVANQLADDTRIKALSFIGSSRVGALLYERAAKAGKRMQAMMGAKNHCVVMPDANRSQAINSLLGSAFGAAGQRCMANSVVVLVGEARAWLDELVEGARGMRAGSGTQREADLGPLVSPQAKARVEGLIAQGEREGATLELDGRGYQVEGYSEGNFVGPTLFSNVTAEMQIYREEIFG